MAKRSVDELRTLLANPLVAAGLGMLQVSETNRLGGYDIQFADSNPIKDLSKHPNVRRSFVNNKGERIWSTAAGAYQFIYSTWLNQAKKLGLTDFSADSQDLAALGLLDDIGALDDLINGRIMDAITKMGDQWAALPGSRLAAQHGQSSRSPKVAFGTFNYLLRQNDPDRASQFYLRAPDGSVPFEELKDGRPVDGGKNTYLAANMGGGSGGSSTVKMPEFNFNERGELVFPSMFGGRSTRDLLNERYARRGRFVMNTTPLTPTNAERLGRAALGIDPSTPVSTPNTVPNDPTIYNLQQGAPTTPPNVSVTSPQAVALAGSPVGFTNTPPVGIPPTGLDFQTALADMMYTAPYAGDPTQNYIDAAITNPDEYYSRELAKAQLNMFMSPQPSMYAPQLLSLIDRV